MSWRDRIAAALSDPKQLFHVAGPEYKAGQPLRSLYSQQGNAAYDTFAQRWPDAGDLSLDHVHKTFFYTTPEDAARHAEDFGGTVFQVDPRRVEGLRFEKTEAPGYWVTNQDVPPEALYPGGRDWLLVGSK